MISRAHKIRLYPNEKQRMMLAKTAGTVRYAYTWAIDECERRYKQGLPFDIYAVSRTWTVEREAWAKEVPAASVQKGILRAGGAYKNMFRHNAKHPKYHKKGVHDSFYINNQEGRVCGKKIKLGKIGCVRAAEPLRYEDCRIMSFNVSKECNKWYVSVQVEILEEARTNSTSDVGVDVGLEHWAVATNGTVLKSPKQLKHYVRELKRKQRLAARKMKRSNNQKKAYGQIAKLYRKINNIKLDAIHKFTAAIAKNHGTVVIEDLNIDGMKKGQKSIRRGIQNAAMGEILRQLKYKCNNYVTVDRWYPSSQLCSSCGSRQEMPVDRRTYTCKVCGMSMDRDVNAALNILKEGRRIISTCGQHDNACGTTVDRAG